MKINTVAILGAGAVGGYFIWGLSEKLKGNLWVIADGSRKKRLESGGININGQNFKLNVRTPKEAHGTDLLLIATKYGALNDILDDAGVIVDGHTIVLSLLNGVDSEEIIGRRIGNEHIVYSMMKIASERKDSGITFNGAVTPGLFYGEAGQKKSRGQKVPSERMKAIAELLDGTPLNHHMCEDIIREIWCKFALNISCNQPQAMIGCGVGAYDDSIHMAHICQKLKDEVTAIAMAKGIDIRVSDTENTRRSASTRAARYSTLQDLDAGRHTEVDMFAGTVIRMGKELGIPTPYNEFAYHVIKALEEKNDGKFDYD